MSGILPPTPAENRFEEYTAKPLQCVRISRAGSGYVLGTLLMLLGAGLALAPIFLPVDMIKSGDLDLILEHHLWAGPLLIALGLWVFLRRSALVLGSDGSFTIERWLLWFPRHRHFPRDQVFGLMPRLPTAAQRRSDETRIHRLEMVLMSGKRITLFSAGTADRFWDEVRKIEQVLGVKVPRMPKSL
ncbi:hypothetical protein JXA47_05500 [Candidatus Sumerlaeota bacterium]|nr:hypothetical protein [Candidatus Sumerlaeota bacterium]